MNEKRYGMILIVSGPSGSDKSTLCNAMFKEFSGLEFSVSCTTRAPRGGERDGVEYHFLSREQFEEHIRQDDFLEYANVHGNFYGTLKSEVYDRTERGTDVLLDIDVQGARQIRSAIAGSPIKPSFVTVFIAPPSLTELERRLRGRGTETEESIQKRLRNARTELGAIDEYQFCVVNDKLEQAAEDFLAIVQATRCRTPLQKANIPLFD